MSLLEAPSDMPQPIIPTSKENLSSLNPYVIVLKDQHHNSVIVALKFLSQKMFELSVGQLTDKIMCNRLGIDFDKCGSGLTWTDGLSLSYNMSNIVLDREEIILCHILISFCYHTNNFIFNMQTFANKLNFDAVAQSLLNLAY